jgi:hypothetical protein
MFQRYLVLIEDNEMFAQFNILIVISIWIQQLIYKQFLSPLSKEKNVVLNLTTEEVKCVEHNCAVRLKIDK